MFSLIRHRSIAQRSLRDAAMCGVGRVANIAETFSPDFGFQNNNAN